MTLAPTSRSAHRTANCLLLRSLAAAGPGGRRDDGRRHLASPGSGPEHGGPRRGAVRAIATRALRAAPGSGDRGPRPVAQMMSVPRDRPPAGENDGDAPARVSRMAVVARRRLALLRDAGAAIGRTLDVARTAQEFVDFAVPLLAR